jgi:hypothetical protein
MNFVRCTARIQKDGGGAVAPQKFEQHLQTEAMRLAWRAQAQYAESARRAWLVEAAAELTY